MATSDYPPLPVKRLRLWVDDSGAQALRDYKYAGVDLSYIYRYILTPMNEVLVKFIPRWVAPNLITLAGLFVCVLCHIVVWHHTNDYGASGPLPPWVCAYVAATLIAYQTLDNLDGKQARRTKNGSALGLLFDHGVDALNTTIVSQTFAAVVQAGPTWRLAALWFFTFCPFVFATWDEYYTHLLMLGELNGPTDGVMLSACFCLLQGYIPGFWSHTLGTHIALLRGTALEHTPALNVILGIGFVGVGLTVTHNVYRVLTSESGKEAGLPRVFSKLLPFTLIAGAASAWAVYSPADIFHAQPRMFLFAIGILFAALICKLMLAHLTKGDYRIFRTSVVPLLFAATNAAAPRLFGLATTHTNGTLFGIDELLALKVVLACSITSWLLFALPVIWEITTVLNIRCFIVKPYDPNVPLDAPASAPANGKPKAH